MKVEERFLLYNPLTLQLYYTIMQKVYRTMGVQLGGLITKVAYRFERSHTSQT